MLDVSCNRDIILRRMAAAKKALDVRGVVYSSSQVDELDEINYQLQGPAARVWWLVLCSPDGATYRDVAHAFCETVQYYGRQMLSSYVKQPNRHYSDGPDRRKATHWHGTQLNGVLHRLLTKGYVTAVNAGPRGGLLYRVKPWCKVPTEVLR